MGQVCAVLRCDVCCAVLILRRDGDVIVALTCGLQLILLQVKRGLPQMTWQVQPAEARGPAQSCCMMCVRWLVFCAVYLVLMQRFGGT